MYGQQIRRSTVGNQYIRFKQSPLKEKFGQKPVGGGPWMDFHTFFCFLPLYVFLSKKYAVTPTNGRKAKKNHVIVCNWFNVLVEKSKL